MTRSAAWLTSARQLRSNPGLSPVPVCQPRRDRRCSARWHETPCSRAGKRPLVVRYQRFASQDPSDAELREWHRRFAPCNLGGVVQAGYVVVEADSPDAEAELLTLEPRLAHAGPCRAARPGRGRSWLLRLRDGDVPKNGAGRGRSGKIDIRGPGGLWIVPPSIHVSKHVVSWVPARGLGEVDMIVLDGELRRLVLLQCGNGHRCAAVKTEHSGDSVGIEPNLSPRVQRLLRAHRLIRDLFDGEGKRRGDQSRSGYDYSLAYELQRRGVPHDEVVAALAARPDAHRRDLDYLTTTVAAARWRRR